MVDAPCSRVGHIYRKYSPFGGSGRGDYLGRNYKRVAAVWMDEYAEYVYKHRPHYRDMDAGDLTQQIELRKKLQCKSFKWFMTEVAFDLPKHYPPIEPEDFVSGEIKSTADSSLCVDSDYNRVGEEIGMQKCMKGKGGKSGGEQQFSLSWRKVKTKCFKSTGSISFTFRICELKTVGRYVGMSTVTNHGPQSHCTIATAKAAISFGNTTRSIGGWFTAATPGVLITTRGPRSCS